MMAAILHSEWYKLRKSKALFVLLAVPLLGVLAGLTADMETGIPGAEWFSIISAINNPYGLLFLPLMTGVLAGTICRYEHQEGGWKQLLALPVTRERVFLAKYMLLLAVMAGMQLLYVAAVYGAGLMQGATEPFPFELLAKIALGGWVAAFPLIALQLWVSIMWKSFAAPFVINVIFTLPAVMIVNSEKFGPYYPWTQPFLMMYAGNRQDQLFFIPWDQLLLVVGGSFLIFFLGGLLCFQRKPV